MSMELGAWKTWSHYTEPPRKKNAGYGVWHLLILELFRKITFERKQHLPTVKESDTFLQFWMFPLWKRYKRLSCLTKASHISPFPSCSWKVMSWNAALAIGPLLVSLIWTTEIIRWVLEGSYFASSVSVGLKNRLSHAQVSEILDFKSAANKKPANNSAKKLR